MTGARFEVCTGTMGFLTKASVNSSLVYSHACTVSILIYGTVAARLIWRDFSSLSSYAVGITHGTFPISKNSFGVSRRKMGFDKKNINRGVCTETGCVCEEYKRTGDGSRCSTCHHVAVKHVGELKHLRSMVIVSWWQE